jgi:hypothetical protein
MGPCTNENTICYVNKITNDHMFICGNSDSKLNTAFIENINEAPATTGTAVTIIAVVIIVLITLLLAWMLMRK